MGKALYHVNPEKGPRRCEAFEGRCPFGKNAPHFRSYKEAQSVFEQSLRLEHGELPRKRRRSRSGVESLDFDSILQKIEDDQTHFTLVKKDVHRRLEETERFYKKLAKVDPYDPSVERPVSKTSYKILLKGLEEYRNVTASRIEALTSCSRWSTPVRTWSKDEKIGLALPVTSYPQSDPRWYTSRMDTVGGSDIGALVVNDFKSSDELTSFDRFKLSSVEKSKVEGVKPPADIDKGTVSPANRRGAAYRGTSWEAWIVDEYARENPQLTVYSSSGQYAHPEVDWTRANFDALTSDRPDGVPNGILEIKTGSDMSKWENGLPLDYRAQTLFYLHVTGFDKAVVRARLNDVTTQDFVVNRTDEVAPGSGVTFDEYMTTRVERWFEDLRNRRKVNE